MKKRVIAVVLCVAMVALVCAFAACSGKTNDSESTTGSDISNVITVGYTVYEPMNYFNENNELVGFDTDLAKAVFEKLGYTVLFKEIKWENKYTDLASGTIDCIWNGFTANSTDDDGVARSEKVDFSFNYMENNQVVVVKKDSGIATPEDLSEKIGEAESGSAGESYANGFEGAVIKGVTKQTDALMDVNSGVADFAVLDVQLANSYCGNGDYSDLVIVEALSNDVEYYAIGFAKGSELTAKVNAQLEALAADGTLKKIAEYYGVENSVITDFADQK